MSWSNSSWSLSTGGSSDSFKSSVGAAPNCLQGRLLGASIIISISVWLRWFHTFVDTLFLSRHMRHFISTLTASCQKFLKLVKICPQNTLKPYRPKRGSTNMPLFGRDHECNEYEHRSGKKVWIMSGMKWTLPKNKGDPQKDTSETRTHSGQQNEQRGFNLKRKWCLKCLWSHTKGPGPL